ALRDLVRRPHGTIDLLPWWRRGDDVFVLARTSFPRPILGAAEASFDGAPASTWSAEPITLVRPDAPLGRVVAAALVERGGAEEAWLGETPVVGEAANVVAAPVSALLPEGRRVFEAAPGCSAGFLARRSAVFAEFSAEGTELARKTLEWVEPVRHSLRTVAV